MADHFTSLVKAVYGGYVSLAFFGALTAVCLYFLTLSVYGTYMQYQTATWENKNAVIESIDGYKCDPDGTVINTGKVGYQYQINDRTYHADRIDYSVADYDARWNEVSGYTSGMQVHVYVDSRVPSRSVLSNRRITNALAIIGSLFVLIFALWPILIFLARVNQWPGFDFKKAPADFNKR